ncbi:MAG TPA: GTP-binding protein [Casimicrobiaceae bacterium]|nr:GTP-binding protein [Casimicrobiaceae bacterium]
MIPVHVLTGFLGSGKTTLLNRALRSGLGADTAVVVNEFGAIGLDHVFVQSHSEETVVLASGCVCCTVRSDLSSTLLRMIARRRDDAKPLRRVLIETSGIAEPLPILQTLRSDFNLRTRFRAGSVVCAVSAIDDTTLHRRREAIAQITAADGIVITKGDLAHTGAAQAVQSAAATLNPLAHPVPAEGPAFVDWLVHREDAPDHGWRAGHLQDYAPAHAHSHGIRSVTIRAPIPPSWARFAVWLTRLVFLHGDRVLRTKGVLFDRERNMWIGVHGVGRFFHPPVHLELASPPAEGACLVFITENLDPALIERSFARIAHADAAPELADSAA